MPMLGNAYLDCQQKEAKSGPQLITYTAGYSVQLMMPAELLASIAHNCHPQHKYISSAFQLHS